MKYLDKPAFLLALMFRVIMGAAFTSCVPSGDPAGGGGGSGSDEEGGVVAKPLPTGVEPKVIGLFYDTRDNLAGLGLAAEGYLTTIISDYGDWSLAPVGILPGLGNVDYIPTEGWDNLIFPAVGLGFVGYNSKQGFVRFIIGGLYANSNTEVTGVALMYLGNFTGSEDPIELKEWSYEFSPEGGVQHAQIAGDKYSTYQTYTNRSWVTIRRTSSHYKFIEELIEMTVEPNTTTEPREAIVTIRTSAGQESSFKIYQEGLPSPEDDEEAEG